MHEQRRPVSFNTLLRVLKRRQCLLNISLSINLLYQSSPSTETFQQWRSCSDPAKESLGPKFQTPHYGLKLINLLLRYSSFDQTVSKLQIEVTADETGAVRDIPTASNYSLRNNHSKSNQPKCHWCVKKPITILSRSISNDHDLLWSNWNHRQSWRWKLTSRLTDKKL